MSEGIVDTNVVLLKADPLASEYEFLGVSILAHLLALPQLFSRDCRIYEQTIECYGQHYRHPEKKVGYLNGWVGKSFEYAVAEIFNSRMEPFYSIIYKGIAAAFDWRVSERVSTVDLDLDDLSCVRVSKECPNAQKLRSELGRFRILGDARRTITKATETFPGLEEKVDVLFCEKDRLESRRFGVLASLKINRERLLADGDMIFTDYPLDLAITVESERFRDVQWDDRINAYVVYLPMDTGPAYYAWENATKILDRALIEGEGYRLVRYFRSFFRPETAASYWVEFLAERLRVNMGELTEELRGSITRQPNQRLITVPVLSGGTQDAAVDLAS